jgi:hypothetical protein
MRSQLMLFLGGKYLFSARVAKFGLRHVARRGAEPTMLLKDVLLHTGTVIVPVDHLWAYVGKNIARFNPRKGDRISFYAWVREYQKYDYESGLEKLDYCIERLSKLDLVSSGCCGQDFATFWNQLRQSKKFITDRLVVPCTA